MKFRLWHMILSEMANLSLGQKNLRFCQMKVLEKILSSPNAFPILVNIKPYQKNHQKHIEWSFQFFPTQIWCITDITKMPQVDSLSLDCIQCIPTCSECRQDHYL